MKKTILFVVALVLVISLASAIEEGQNITQAQLDSFNPENINWQFLKCQDEHEILIQKPYILQKYSCLELYENEDFYTVYRNEYYVISGVHEWKQCLAEQNPYQCWLLYLEHRIKPQVKETIIGIRQWVLDHQTDEESDWLIDYLQNYTIGDPE